MDTEFIQPRESKPWSQELREREFTCYSEQAESHSRIVTDGIGSNQDCSNIHLPYNSAIMGEAIFEHREL